MKEILTTYSELMPAIELNINFPWVLECQKSAQVAQVGHCSWWSSGRGQGRGSFCGRFMFASKNNTLGNMFRKLTKQNTVFITHRSEMIQRLPPGFVIIHQRSEEGRLMPSSAVSIRHWPPGFCLNRLGVSSRGAEMSVFPVSLSGHWLSTTHHDTV